MASSSLAQDILVGLGDPFTGELLFDHLSDIVFFIKNTHGQYVVVNQTLVERCGVRQKSEIIGRAPAEVFPAPLGERYQAQDEVVLRTGRSLITQLELHIYPTRDVGWCLTTKLPLRKANGQITGLVGVSQDLKLPDASMEEFQHLAAAVAHAEANLSTPPSVDELARIAGMSRYQFDRRMRKVYGLTTGQWLTKIRIDLAQRLLTETKQPIADIALEAGYSDQSAFTRQFRQSTGLSPREFRTNRMG